MKNICVIGSMNMDTTTYIKGSLKGPYDKADIDEKMRIEYSPGGKANNQARSARLQLTENSESKVFLIGCVGDDKAGENIKKACLESKVDISGVETLVGKKTDGRLVEVTTQGKDKGQNKMIGFGDCIKQITPEMLKRHEDILLNSDIVMIQLKMPEDTVKFIIEYCAEKGKTIIVDPAPEKNISVILKNNLLDKIDYLTPNEDEAFFMKNLKDGLTMDEINDKYERLSREERLKEVQELVKENKNVIATVGSDGVYYQRYGMVIKQKTFETECVDSTGAGDTFNGAFSAALSRGEDFEKAIAYGLMASSMKVKVKTAQAGMPTYEQMKEELDKVIGKGKSSF